MPALRRTTAVAKIVWLGSRPEEPDDPDGIRSVKKANLELGFSGADGEIHSGLTRPSCVRVRHLYEQGTEIRNTRQLSIVSAEELLTVARKLGLDEIDPVWLGASIVVEGINDFSHVPPSSRLLSENGCGLIVDMENQPCVWPGKEIERDHPGRGREFSRVAIGMRGITASVERPGKLSIGDDLSLYVPSQPPWIGEQKTA